MKQCKSFVSAFENYLLEQIIYSSSKTFPSGKGTHGLGSIVVCARQKFA